MGVLDYLNASAAGDMGYLDSEGGAGGAGGGPTAADLVTYDHTASGLSATDVQAAIDEVAAASGGGGGTAAGTTYDHTASGLAATNVQAALDEVKSDIPVFAGVKVHPAGGTFGTGSYTAIPFTTEDYDIGGYHDNVTNNTRLTVPAGKGGKYLISFVIDHTATGFAYLRKNGTDIAWAYARIDGAGTYVANAVAEVDLAAGDYIELMTSITSGTLDSQSTLAMTLMGGAPSLVGSGFMGASAWASGTQSVPTATDTPLAFDSEDYDSNAIHNPSTNPTRFTVPVGGAGKWMGVAYVVWDANTSGVRYLWWRKNGTRIRSSLVAAAPAAWGSDTRNTLGPIDLNDGDYIEVGVYQDSGGTRTIGAASGDQRAAAAVWRVPDGSVGGGPSGLTVLGTFDYTEATADGATKNLLTIPAGTLVRDILTVIDVPFASAVGPSVGAFLVGIHLGDVGGTQYSLDQLQSSTVENATLKGRSAVRDGNAELPKIAATDLVPQARWLNSPQGTGWVFSFNENGGNEDITGGTFTLTVNGITTAPIAWNANAATFLAAAKSAFGNGNVVSADDVNFNGNNDGSTITFASAFQPTSLPTVNLSGLTGPEAPYAGGGNALGLAPTSGHATFYRL